MIFQLLAVSQVPPDSLTGYYIGEYWFRIENDPWEIRDDTVNVTSINPDGCWIQMFTWDNGSWTTNFTSSYEFCFGTPINWYIHFHNDDSITIQYDDISTPPPDPILQSHRFYGKKAWITTVVENRITDDKLIVYPNPADDWILLNSRGSLVNNSKVNFRVITTAGNKVIEGIYSYNDRINTAELKSGIYIIILETSENMFIGKFVKL